MKRTALRSRAHQFHLHIDTITGRALCTQKVSFSISFFMQNDDTLHKKIKFSLSYRAKSVTLHEKRKRPISLQTVADVVMALFRQPSGISVRTRRTLKNQNVHWHGPFNRCSGQMVANGLSRLLSRFSRHGAEPLRSWL